MLMNVVDDDEMRFPLLHTIGSILAWMSAVVNPFIYAFKNRQYQQAFTKVITAPDTIVPLLSEMGSRLRELGDSVRAT